MIVARLRTIPVAVPEILHSQEWYGLIDGQPVNIKPPAAVIAAMKVLKILLSTADIAAASQAAANTSSAFICVHITVIKYSLLYCVAWF